MSVLLRDSEYRCEECDSPWIAVFWVSEAVRKAQLRESQNRAWDPAWADPKVKFSHADGVLATARAVAYAHAEGCHEPPLAVLDALGEGS